MAVPLASASSFIQLDRQLRQNPAKFIRSMFWTSVRERRCSTRRRKTAASSSVLVLSSIVMAVIPRFGEHDPKNGADRPSAPASNGQTEHIDITTELSHISPHPPPT